MTFRARAVWSFFTAMGAVAVDSAKGCTAKALSVGLVGAVCLGLGSTYNDMIIKGSGLAVWNLTPGAIFLFFLVVVGNGLVRWVYPRLALVRGELAVVFFLLLLANTLSGRGLPVQLLPVMTGAYYYATPENNWRELVQPFLPDWPLPQGDEAVRRFYEGAPDGAIPWDVWVAPLCWWAIFGLALFLAMICLMVIVRRQWVEHERLSYPMVQLPLALLGGEKQKPLLRRGLVWIGFAVPFILGSINALHNYYGVFPQVSLSLGSVEIVRGMPTLGLGLNPSMIGFSYFVPQNVASGLVVFFLFNRLQSGLLTQFAWGGKDASMGPYSQYTDSVIIYQAMGGMIVLVLGTLWVGREHLRAVLRRALRGAAEVEDGDEIMSYRAAVAGAIISFMVMTVWLWRTGMPLPVAVMLLVGSFVGFITITRVVAQGGVASMFPPSNGPDFVISGVGASLLGFKGTAGLALSYAWGVDQLILLMAACANGLKLFTEIDLAGRRRMFGGVLAVIVLTLSSVIGLTLYLAYEHGAINLSNFYFNNVAQYPYNFMSKNVQTPEGPSPGMWSHTWVGAGIMGALMWLQYRFVWWPFHPLGFPISCVFGSMWFSVFVAWAIKGTVLKYGGLGLFERLKPLFLGLILGEAVVAGFWVVVDYCTGMQGNITMR